MKRSLHRWGWNAAAVAICLAAGPVLAGSSSLFFHETFYAHLYGVDRCGNLRYSLGTDTEFDALVNTRNGSYIGTARDTVTNNSGQFQLFLDSGAFIYDDVLIRDSLYLVSGNGCSFLLAIGNVTDTRP